MRKPDPTLLNRVLTKALQALGRGAHPIDIAQYISDHTEGKFTSLAGLKQHVEQLDRSPGKVEGIARGVTRGLTLGFNDEIAGLADAIMGGNYRETRDTERQASKDFHAAHPVLATSSEIAGGVAPAVAGFFASAPAAVAGTAAEAAPSLAQLFRNGVIAGGAAGGAAGVGESEATDLRGLGSDALLGAGLGAGIGGGFGLLQKPIAGAVGGIADAIQSMRDPVKAGGRRALQAVGRIAPADLGGIVSRLEASRPGMGMVADASPSTRMALRGAANMSPEIADAAAARTAARQSGAGERLADDLLESANVPGLDGVAVKDAMTGIMGRGKPFNRKLYGPLEAMYREIPQGPESANLIKFFEDPRVRKAYTRAIGDNTPPEMPGFREMQSTLHELQDEASSAFASARGNQGGDMADLARNFANAMEESMPGFKAANRGYATGAKTIEAFENGAKAMSKDSREIRKQIARAREVGGEEAVDAFRMGMLDKVAQDLRSMATNRDAAARFTEMGPEIEAKLMQAFPDKAKFAEFIERAEVERMFNQTHRAVGGNSTTSGQANMEATIAGTGGLSVPTRSNALAALVNKLDDAIYGGAREQAGKQTGQLLLSGGPEAQPVMDAVARERARLLAAAARSKRISGLLPWVSGAGAGRVGASW